MSTLAQDVRFAIRTLLNAPGFTAVAVLSLAVGVGANTSIFSVASALLLRPLAYRDADRLVILWNRSPGIGIAEDWFSTAQYFDVKRGHTGFEEVAIAIGANWNLTGDGEPERVGTLRVSSNLLPMLGVEPALGRLFGPEADVPNGGRTALLGHGTWVRRYGSDPNVVGRALTLNGQPYEIIGVLPAAFDLPREALPTLGGAEHAEIVLPLPLANDAPRVRNGEDYNLMGKLRRGVTLAQAQAEMDALTARLRAEHPNVYPANGGLTFSIVPLQEQVVGDVRRSLGILTAAVGFVLLIACANVANLLLSRGLGRQREMGVRSALGASRSRILRQLLTESVLLSLVGGALGLLLSYWTVDAIRALGIRSVPRLGEVEIDARVLLFTLLVSVGAGILFGLLPGLRLSGSSVVGTLRDSGRSSTAAGGLLGRRHRSRQFLVAAELALSVVLLIGAGLLIRSFVRLQQVSPGFNPSGVLTLELTMAGRKYGDPARVLETYQQLWRRLETLPGVTAAGGVSMLPLSQMFAWGPIVLEGRPLPGGESFVNVDQRTVGAGYFQAMEIPLIRGRLFTEQDTRETPRVVVIDDHMADALWPGEDPIGKRLRRGGMDADPNAPWLTVVGIVGSIKQYTLDERDSRIAMYHPHTQAPSRAMNVVIRTASDPAGLASGVTAQIRALDPYLPIYNVRTMSQRVEESLARRRFAMLLLSLFAGLAVALAAVGVYGVMAYLVSQGAREIGIRMALGATPEAIRALVVGQSARVALAGAGTGLIASLALARFMRSLLFGVQARDPLTFGATAALLAVITILASYVPARRAAAVDPISSLRSE